MQKQTEFVINISALNKILVNASTLRAVLLGFFCASCRSDELRQFQTMLTVCIIMLYCLTFYVGKFRGGLSVHKHIEFHHVLCLRCPNARDCNSVVVVC